MFVASKERGLMEDLKFQELEAQIDQVRRRFATHREERRQWERDRGEYERKLRALADELESLREAGERLAELHRENESFRKNQDVVRQQVMKMLERIGSLE
jgi:uncharacterized coiled-coil DUF342 family protein